MKRTRNLSVTPISEGVCLVTYDAPPPKWKRRGAAFDIPKLEEYLLRNAVRVISHIPVEAMEAGKDRLVNISGYEILDDGFRMRVTVTLLPVFSGQKPRTFFLT